MEADRDDVEALIREKYAGDRSAPGIALDTARLAAGEPLAYVIGNIPFLGLTIGLHSRPLIPRPETEWWTDELARHIGNRPLKVLDLCAGSGAIGLGILSQCPTAHVSFGELMPRHAETIRKNMAANEIDSARSDIRTGDLFAPFNDDKFDIIATNPPYIPDTRNLHESVASHEPPEALFSGADGLTLIRRIIEEAPHHLLPHGELWMECDIANIKDAKKLCLTRGFKRAEIRNDQYGRSRLIVAHL